MRKPLSLTALLVAAALVACSPPPSATATPEARIVGPGERARITAEPASGPTEECPQVILHLTITDKQAGQPVPAAIAVDGQVAATFVTEAKVPLSGRPASPVLLTVVADGYQKWEAELHWSVNYHREVIAPIELVPGESEDDSQSGA
jgi:hypothetical protein